MTDARACALATQIIQQFEDCETQLADGRLQAYWDADGRVWTIGWGSTGRDVRKGTIWTRAHADARLQQTVASIDHGIDHMLRRALEPHQRAALISFAYNCGLDDDDDDKAEGLGDSTLLRAVNAGDDARAGREFLKWVHSGGHILRGLVRRRNYEMNVYLGRLPASPG